MRTTLATVTAWSGTLRLDDDAGLSFVPGPGQAPTCSLSQTSGTLALLVARSDPLSPVWAAYAELYVLEVDTRSASAPRPPARIQLEGIVPENAQQTASDWRLVSPFLQFS